MAHIPPQHEGLEILYIRNAYSGEPAIKERCTGGRQFDVQLSEYVLAAGIGAHDDQTASRAVRFLNIDDTSYDCTDLSRLEAPSNRRYWEYAMGRASFGYPSLQQLVRIETRPGKSRDRLLQDIVSLATQSGFDIVVDLNQDAQFLLQV